MYQFLIPMAMGLMNAQATKKKNEQMKQQNLAEAEKTRYSAWSGLGPGQINNNYGDPFSAGVSGALQGLAVNQAVGQAGGWGSLLGQEEQANQLAMNLGNNKFGSMAQG
ncbi:MAG: hypothetical protein ACK5UJ_02290 [Pseudobdellovibrionaceae bacterium]|nr:hypothetical protein [Pseudanabaena sp. M151S2SP2A07QC]